MFDRRQSSFQALSEIISTRTQKVVFWVGAGLSAQAGVPTWVQLRDILIAANTANSETMHDDETRKTKDKLRAAFEAPSLWVAFKILKSINAATYRSIITSRLNRPQDTTPLPYELIWKIPSVAGIITLNIDQFATNSCREVRNTYFRNFHGHSLGDNGKFLKDNSPFICSMHGIAEEYSTWIFTSDELSELQSKQAYNAFCTSLFMNSTIVFSGVSADDIAIKSHLDFFRTNRIDCGDHFWITDRRDGLTNKKAEEAGLQIIRYTSTGGDHTELNEIFTSLIEAEPPSECADVAPALNLLELKPGDLSVGIDNLVGDSLRNRLNYIANGIFSSESEDTFSEYHQFMLDNDEKIHAAWHIPKDGSSFFGYKILNRIAIGSFGVVYKAEKNDRYFAIKLLKSELRDEPEMMKSFRRGVRCMKILNQHKIEGTVEFIESTEIPSIVVMEFIDGEVLSEFVDRGELANWSSYIKCAISIARVLKVAHNLPEKVLHRDIRPANIMRYYNWVDEVWVTKILDFDMAWHKGAYEQSIVNNAASYLSPEQITRSDVPTRTTLVDSYGFGMLLYFMASRKDPAPNQQKWTSWKTDVANAINRVHSGTWKSMPARMQRLIVYATKDIQSERIAFSDILSELEMLEIASNGEYEGVSLFALAEEFIARSDFGGSYEYLPNSIRARTPRGTIFNFEPDPSQAFLIMHVNQANSGFVDWTKERSRSDASDRLQKTLSKIGGLIESVTVRDGSLVFEGKIPRSAACDPDKMANTLNELKGYVSNQGM